MERYFTFEIENGFCGFDENFLVIAPNGNEPDFEDFINENYSYLEGGGGLDPYDTEEYEDYSDYFEEILDNSCCEEISKEQFEQLKEDYGDNYIVEI